MLEEGFCESEARNTPSGYLRARQAALPGGIFQGCLIMQRGAVVVQPVRVSVQSRHPAPAPGPREQARHSSSPVREYWACETSWSPSKSIDTKDSGYAPCRVRHKLSQSA